MYKNYKYKYFRSDLRFISNLKHFSIQHNVSELNQNLEFLAIFFSRNSIPVQFSGTFLARVSFRNKLM